MEFNPVMFEIYARRFVLTAPETRMRDGRSALPNVLRDYRPFVSAPDGQNSGNPLGLLDARQECGEMAWPNVATATFIYRVDHQQRAGIGRLGGCLQRPDERVWGFPVHPNLFEQLTPWVARVSESLTH